MLILYETETKTVFTHFLQTWLCFLKAKESWEMDLKQKLDLAAGVKHKGNQYFKVRSPCQSFIFTNLHSYSAYCHKMVLSFLP